MTQRPIFVTSEDAAYELNRRGARVGAATIRQWGRRRQITIHRDSWPRYDLREILEHAAKKGLIAK